MKQEEANRLNPDQYEDVYLEYDGFSDENERLFVFRCVSKVMPDRLDVQIRVVGNQANYQDPAGTSIRYASEPDDAPGAAIPTSGSPSWPSTSVP